MNGVRGEAMLVREATEQGPRPFGAFHSRKYRFFWAGSLLTCSGQWVDGIVAAWLMLLLTNSPFFVGLVSFMRGIPMLTIAPFAGVLADRLDRRRFLRLNQTLLALTALVTGILAALQWIPPWALLVSVFLSGAGFAMTFTAGQALIPALVSRKDEPSAISLYSVASNATRVLGSALGGTLIGLLGTALCYFLEAVCHFGALSTSLQLPASSPARRESEETIWQKLYAGFACIRQEKKLVALLSLSGVIGFFGMWYFAMMPVLARDTYGLGPEGLGVLLSCAAAGSLVGSISVTALSHARHRGSLALLSTLLCSVAQIAFSLSGSFYVACAIIVIVGLGNTFSLVMINNLIQSNSPDDFRGRVMSVYVMTIGLNPVGILLAGTIAQLGGAPLAIGLGGVACAISTILIALLVPELRKVE